MEERNIKSLNHLKIYNILINYSNVLFLCYFYCWIKYIKKSFIFKIFILKMNLMNIKDYEIF